MNENTNPEVTEEKLTTASEEEVAESVTEETAETTVEGEKANTVIETDNEINDTAADANTIEKSADAESSEETEKADEEKPAKKKSFLQIPVIISLCIVIAAILGYFVFTGFFLKEPEGVTWSNEIDGATYYYEFNNDGTFRANVGSVEINSTYQKTKSDEGNTLTVSTNIGSLYGSAPATYTISGSRILGNQTLEGSYGEGYDFTLIQSKKETTILDLPEEFTPDEDLVGTWFFKYMGYDIYKATFNQDGSMTIEFVQDGIKYSGVYTIDGSTVNFTYCVTENVAVPIEYSLVDHDTLTFMGYSFVREGSAAAEATPDQQILTPQE